LGKEVFQAREGALGCLVEEKLDDSLVRLMLLAEKLGESLMRLRLLVEEKMVGSLVRVDLNRAKEKNSP
jgi:hypothetical protein